MITRITAPKNRIIAARGSFIRIEIIYPATRHAAPIILRTIFAFGSRSGADAPFSISIGFDILIDNISYSYENTDNKILKDFSLKIKKGQLTGIMGASGCGKSTLLKLLMRFWDVDSGKIILDRKDVKSVPLKELYQKFNYMTQSTSLFIGNIRDNLLVAKADATDEEIYTALKKASFYDYVMSLPDKLDSIVEEGGKNFSGGERQRIGLARAFLANREFFLLDEPTSNLDILNEAIILKSLADEAKDKTVILVSHRESTLSICNEVFKI